MSNLPNEPNTPNLSNTESLPNAAQAPVVAGREELLELRDLAAELAREAGRLIVAERPEVLDVADTKSSEVDIVTVMDRRSETLLRERIAALRPQDGILGEEDGVSPGTSGFTWVIDPIDGTVNYLYQQPLFAVSVALCIGDVTTDGAWSSIVGAVDSPMTGETFVAAAGCGAELRRADGRITPLKVTDEDRLELSLVATGFGYGADKRAEQGRVLSHVLPQVRDIRRGGAAALDLCYVGAGRLNAYYESGINAWDQAAGQLVASEAGAIVSGAAGEAAGKKLVIAAVPGIHAALRDCLFTAPR